MPASRERINELFLAALERQASERAAFISESCGEDHELRLEVLALLKAHAAAGEFLEQPAAIWAGLVPAQGTATLVGRHIGPYRVDAEIGRGGMGVVYLAEDTRLGRKVALKALAPEVTGDERRRAWLRREARAAGALSHPGIATVYALEDIDGQFFIASEFAPGRTLRAALGSRGLPPAECLSIALQMARALQAAHARGVVHRDLKPENVMCGPDGAVKLVDFGIAWFDEETPPGVRFTEVGLVAGTPSYMSPEQIEGGPVDLRSDLFSFGVVLYEMACGTNPFEAPTPLATAARVAAADPPPLGAKDAAVPPGLERIIRRCLMKRREERYASAVELVAALEQLQRDLARETRPASSSQAADVAPGGPAPAARRSSWTARAWWTIHQAVVLAFYAAVIYPMWVVHSWAGGGWPLMLVAAYIAMAVVNGVLRIHLLFTHQVTPSELPAQLGRSGPWIARSDFAISVFMLFGAATAAMSGHGPTALLLAAVAVGLLAVSLVVEPATTAAAFPEPRIGSGP